MISISTYSPVSPRQQTIEYGAVQLFLVSLPVVLVVFDGGGKQSVAKRRFSYKRHGQTKTLPTRDELAYLGQIPLCNVSRCQIVVGDGAITSEHDGEGSASFRDNFVPGGRIRLVYP